MHSCRLLQRPPILLRQLSSISHQHLQILKSNASLIAEVASHIKGPKNPAPISSKLVLLLFILHLLILRPRSTHIQNTPLNFSPRLQRRIPSTRFKKYEPFHRRPRDPRRRRRSSKRGPASSWPRRLPRYYLLEGLLSGEASLPRRVRRKTVWGVLGLLQGSCFAVNAGLVE